ncbi:MAG: zinc carboxypeptidase [Flavobacteriales bacterium]|jgi:hypothetical protein|nr:zinc carboxypeptidase [Flavobacteriales bacterium]MBT5750326.1 zinc carboxypeptidase [Flavobacteriales bacterium]
MKKILLILFIPLLSFSQNTNNLFSKKGEVYFSFDYKNKHQLNELSEIISVDHKTNSEIAYAYANQKEFTAFIKLGIDYTIIKEEPLNYSQNSKNNWNYYPTYEEYVDMMIAFADSFPSICKLHYLGTLNSGREILIVQISNNVGQKENEPSFLYTSSMHGDELAGYILSLRLIDHILHGYGNNLRLTELVDNIDIWINPLANPDGTYAGGNQDVWTATRYNANWVDLNRNYPDPEDGAHPDGNPYQTETNIFIGLADTVNFTISANMHGGAEVCNYPWDTWSTLAADDNWWQHVSREYADSCQANSGNGYFEWNNWNNPFANGVVNGYDWYTVNGGRQDYMNYFKYCREFTLELSVDKTPNPNDLPSLWDANYPSLINYMEQILFGLRGIATDSITGNPLKVKVEILSHDIDSSHVYSNLPIGNYHRYLYQGNYDVTFSKSGYYPKTINTTILNNTSTIENIQLVPINSTPTSVTEEVTRKTKNLFIDVLGRNSKQTKNSIELIKTERSTLRKQVTLE